MESLTLETNARKIFTTSEAEVIHPTPFNLICLDNISESFELVPGQKPGNSAGDDPESR